MQQMAEKQRDRKKTYELIMEELKEMIILGQLKPGEQLDSVEQLAKKFAVSRSVIREALSALSAMGYIDIRHGHGTFVTKPDLSSLTHPIASSRPLNAQEMLQFFEVRKIIESGTAKAAAIRRTDQNLEKMRAALVAMKQAGHDLKLGEEADVNFHLAIAEATQNELLIQLMHSISHTLSQTMLESRRILYFYEETSLEKLYREHQAIYEAIVDQNAGLAQELMLAHLKKVEEVYVRSLNQERKKREEKE